MNYKYLARKYRVSTIILAILVLILSAYIAITPIDTEIIDQKFLATIRRFRLGENTWDWFAVTIACASMIFTTMTYWSQRTTEKNTMKITPESQREILIDYARHFYCNLIIICAIEAKLAKRFNEYYPSEEHLLKLKVDLDDLHPAAFYNYASKYSAIHELMVKMRNYNTEIDVAIRHLCNKNVFAQAKMRDFSTLRFKMSFLTQEILKTMDSIWNKNAEQNMVDVKNLIKETSEKRNSNENTDKAAEHLSSFSEQYPYYGNHDSFFVKKLFNGEGEADKFLHGLNCHIYIEMTAKNSEGSDKILLIPFDNPQA